MRHPYVLEDGRIVISGDNYYSLKIWDTKLKSITYVGDEVVACLLPNGNFVYTGTLCTEDYNDFNDKIAQLWNSRTHQLIAKLEGHLDRIEGIVPFFDTRILTWSKDCNLRVWDSITGQCISVLKGHTRSVANAKIMSSGKIISWCDNSSNKDFGSKNDHTIRLWDSNSYECISVLQEHSGEISDISVLQFINSFCSWSSEDKTCIWWDSDGIAIGKPIPLSEDLRAELQAWINYSEHSTRTQKYSSNYYGAYKKKEFLCLSYNFLARLKEYAAYYDEHQYVRTLINEMKSIAELYFKEVYAYDYIDDRIRATSRNNTVEIISLPERTPLVRWQTSDIIEIKALSDDLTLIVSSSNGQIICLKLYEGAKKMYDEYNHSTI